MKKIFNIFVCDKCGKNSDLIEDGRIYPYEKSWVYLHSFRFKEISNQNKGVEDKHFCSKECMKEFVIEKLGVKL